MGREGDPACVTGLNKGGATVVSESCGKKILILLVLLCNRDTRYHIAVVLLPLTRLSSGSNCWLLLKLIPIDPQG